MDDWPEIDVVGPTRTYYDDVFNNVKDYISFLFEEGIHGR